MRPSYFQEQWQVVKQDSEASAIESLSHRVAASFIDRYYYSDEYNREYIHLLCEMATHFQERELNQISAGALFGIVIERLCDDFEELQTETYNRLICQVVNFLCQLPEGKELEEELNGFHLRTEEQLYERIESIRLNPDRRLPGNVRPKKVLVLSRVTIGADVAITSVICQRVARRYPEAEIVVVGNNKLRQVFSEDSNISVLELGYSRRGGLLERFLVWLDLLKKVRAEIAELSPAEFLVLDPDSRLTQLGVLPLVPLQNYRFFNSRGKKGYPAKASIAELTNLWLDHILEAGDFCYPAVWPAAKNLAAAESAINKLDPDRSNKVIILNFGVGGNQRKHVPGDFETELVLTLLQESNTRLVLDLGFGEEEKQRSEAVLSAANQAGFKTEEFAFSELAPTGDCRLLGVKCSVGEIAALISHADEFIGYDSACQHIAAAQGILTHTIFAGTNNVRFIRRWQASGPNTAEIIYVDTISRDGRIDNEEIIARIMDLRQP